MSIERCIGVGCIDFAPLTVLGPNVASYTDTNRADTLLLDQPAFITYYVHVNTYRRLR